MRLPPRPLRPQSFRPHGLLEYRLHVFGEFRGPWRDSFAEAKWDAIGDGLASYDEERGEYYLAVPVGVAQRLRAQAIAA
jgi:hypothetical protein